MYGTGFSPTGRALTARSRCCIGVRHCAPSRCLGHLCAGHPAAGLPGAVGAQRRCGRRTFRAGLAALAATPRHCWPTDQQRDCASRAPTCSTACPSPGTPGTVMVACSGPRRCATVSPGGMTSSTSGRSSGAEDGRFDDPSTLGPSVPGVPSSPGLRFFAHLDWNCVMPASSELRELIVLPRSSGRS